MTFKVQRKIDSKGLSSEEIVSVFRTALTDNSKVYEPSEIEALADLHAKHLTDNFVVSNEDGKIKSIKQGDILIHGCESKYYKEVESSISVGDETDNRNLQDGVAITGDHKVIPVEGANLVINDGMFRPKDNVTRRGRHTCKIITSDKPFLITHQEHGNVALPAGKYLSFVALDPKTQQRIID